MSGEALFEETRNNLPQLFTLPKNQEISYRVVGGTATILEKLAINFSEGELFLNKKVIEITQTEASIKVITEKVEFVADLVISTIPPQLLVNSVDFTSELDTNLLQIANNTHTWMKDAVKFAIVYETPFWKENGLPGVGFSTVGPFTEIYEHSDFENKHFSLMGFLNGASAYKNREESLKKQLFHFFGKAAKNYLSYEEKVWNEETFLSFQNGAFIDPHYNNGNQIYQKEFLNGKFIVAGSKLHLVMVVIWKVLFIEEMKL
jgi:monoamine oxidase